MPQGRASLRLEAAVENKLAATLCDERHHTQQLSPVPTGNFIILFLTVSLSLETRPLEFGSAVHWALEMLFRKMQSNQEAFPGKELLIKEFGRIPAAASRQFYR